MRGDHVLGLAGVLGWTAEVVNRRLSGLRGAGFGCSAGVVRPGLSGRPLHMLTYVSLRSLAPNARRSFEAWCVDDAAVAQAVMMAGPFDYALWSWHVDERAATAWRRGVELRPEVARCDSRPVKVLFGHTLDGAPVFSR